VRAPGQDEVRGPGQDEVRGPGKTKCVDRQDEVRAPARWGGWEWSPSERFAGTGGG
jgi:hypothetical protein